MIIIIFTWLFTWCTRSGEALRLGGLVHKEAYPRVAFVFQSPLEAIYSINVNILLIQSVPSIEDTSWKEVFSEIQTISLPHNLPRVTPSSMLAFSFEEFVKPESWRLHGYFWLSKKSSSDRVAMRSRSDREVIGYWSSRGRFDREMIVSGRDNILVPISTRSTRPIPDRYSTIHQRTRSEQVSPTKQWSISVELGRGIWAIGTVVLIWSAVGAHLKRCAQNDR